MVVLQNGVGRRDGRAALLQLLMRIVQSCFVKVHDDDDMRLIPVSGGVMYDVRWMVYLSVCVWCGLVDARGIYFVGWRYPPHGAAASLGLKIIAILGLYRDQ